MKRMAAAMLLAAGAMILAASPAWAAPKPSEVPINWEFDIHLEDPVPIELTLPGEAASSRFWYVLYAVTNRTGKDQIFVPEFVLYTDTGQILREGQKVPTAVFKAIKKLYNDPLLKDRTAMTGKLLQGEDNAKSGVAIWPRFDPKSGGFDIFLGGLSGETAEVQLPTPIKVTEITARGRKTEVVKNKVVLSKTLQLTYSVPGEEAARPRAKPKLRKKQWVMR